MANLRAHNTRAKNIKQGIKTMKQYKKHHKNNQVKKQGKTTKLLILTTKPNKNDGHGTAC